MTLPTYEESKAAVNNLTATPLQKFIYNYTPPMYGQEDEFRKELGATIAAARAEGFEQGQADGFVYGRTHVTHPGAVELPIHLKCLSADLDNGAKWHHPKAGQG